MAATYNRYQNFKDNGKNLSVPFISLDDKSSDIIVIYKIGVDRMDKLSDKYYQDPTYGWLIMLKNVEFGGLEFSIPDGSIITIPYPLQSSLEDYFKKVNTYFNT